MEEVIVLVNFNKYLGGGETLMVRFAEYLQRNKVNFLAFCMEKSYIHNDLQNKSISHSIIKTITLNPNYYYCVPQERASLVDDIKRKIGSQICVWLVTFCMRDLYTAFALSKHFKNISITHLILHVQDDLYVGQTLLEKLIYKISGIRRFSNKKNIEFNRYLLQGVNRRASLICMSEIISKYWKLNFGIEIPITHIVPLPSFYDTFNRNNPDSKNKKIIWIGRLIDFKIPSLLSMIHYVADNNDYELTIAGAGSRKTIENYIDRNSLGSARIKFIGEVPYDELEKIINQHSVGYAMGTSLVELAKYKIPVIIALASYDHHLFKKQICGGLFFNKLKGCDGSDLILSNQKNIDTQIKDSILQIESDYQNVAQACFDFAKKDYDAERNFGHYLSIIREGIILSEDEKDIAATNASWIRRVLFKRNSE